MTDTPTPRKPARVYTNVRLGVGGLAQIMSIREQAGPHITRSDVIRQCLAEVLPQEFVVRRVLRSLQEENHRREDAANERRHRLEAKRA